MDRHSFARACFMCRPLGMRAVVLMMLLTAAPANAQKDSFIDAFIEFHSEVSGTFGDEGSRAAAALDRMAAALGAWNAANRKAEASLRSGPGFAPSTLALFFLETGRPFDALTAIESAIRLEPARPGIYMFHGILLEAVGRGAEAVESFATAWQLDPDEPLTAYLLADRTASGQAAEVEAQIATLVAASRRLGVIRQRVPFVEVGLINDRASDTPRFAPAAYAEGFALFAQGRYEDAIALFRASLSQDPLAADPIGRSDGVARGVAALKNSQVADALRYFEAVVTRNPSSAEAHRILGLAQAPAGQVAASLEHLNTAIRLASGNERARIALGRVLMGAGRTEEAERALRDTIALLPASGSARWALADLLEKTGRSADAIAPLEEAALLPVPAGRGQLLWRIAGLAYQLHDHERVVTTLTRRTRLMPNDADAHRSLGLAYHRAGRDGQTLIELLTASLMGLETAETLAVMGRIHLNAGRADAAEPVLRRAVVLDAESAEARYAFGQTLMRLGRTVEGRQQLAEFKRLRAAQIDGFRKMLDLELLRHTKELADTQAKK